jgi:hypothetical protein
MLRTWRACPTPTAVDAAKRHCRGVLAGLRSKLQASRSPQDAVPTLRRILTYPLELEEHVKLQAMLGRATLSTGEFTQSAAAYDVVCRTLLRRPESMLTRSEATIINEALEARAEAWRSVGGNAGAASLEAAAGELLQMGSCRAAASYLRQAAAVVSQTDAPKSHRLSCSACALLEPATFQNEEVDWGALAELSAALVDASETAADHDARIDLLRRCAALVVVMESSDLAGLSAGASSPAVQAALRHVAEATLACAGDCGGLCNLFEVVVENAGPGGVKDSTIRTWVTIALTDASTLSRMATVAQTRDAAEAADLAMAAVRRASTAASLASSESERSKANLIILSSHKMLMNWSETGEMHAKCLLALLDPRATHFVLRDATAVTPRVVDFVLRTTVETVNFLQSRLPCESYITLAAVALERATELGATCEAKSDAANKLREWRDLKY